MELKRIIFSSFLIMIVFSCSFAAKTDVGDTTRNKLKFEIPRYRLGISPSAIMGPFPSLQLSHDFRVNNFVEASLETGFVFNSGYNSKGARLRASLEMYLLRDKIVGMFVGVAATSVNMFEQFEYTVTFEETYSREYKANRFRSMFGVYLTGGMKFHLGSGRFLETSAGIGPASLYNSRIQGPQNAELGGIFPSQTGWNSILGFYTNLNLSFPINGN